MARADDQPRPARHDAADELCGVDLILEGSDWLLVQAGSAVGLPMMCWPAGALRRYPAARGDENIDDMVTRGRFECRER